jgi:hypothetical protein
MCVSSSNFIIDAVAQGFLILILENFFFFIHQKLSRVFHCHPSLQSDD